MASQTAVNPAADTAGFSARYGFAPGKRLKVNDFDFCAYRESEHFDTLSDWLGRDYAAFWGMQSLTPTERRVELAPTADKFGLMAYRDAEPVLYTELYDPRFDEVGQHFDCQHGDCGMHLLLAPPTKPQRGFSRQAITAVVSLILQHLGFARLVVEPDINNQKIHPLNRAVGICYSHAVQLENKQAMLGFCTLPGFSAALATGATQ
ncbi:GNAT family N-acetyltransferase [Shewanella algae]|uniref:N-acetyltransferase n=1 Tax=Shewanella algae TaxID=38313 RepID=A0A7T8EBI5_9GAMM|nr:GNAT family N-acetyltransferase [Shewanella algae]MBO2632495.1 acetyltransferase [Shewanella algae]QQO83309.1 N-acetyltransferase [Shewanella algae]